MSGTLSGVYQVDIQKIWAGSETWTNVYHVTAPDSAQAMTHANEIAQLEKAITASDVTINAIRVRPYPTAPGAVGTVNTVNIVGTGTSSTQMPLEVCARVIMSNGTTRASSKFLRAAVSSADFTDRKTLTSVARTRLMTNYVTPLLSKTYLVDVHGSLMPNMSVSDKIANHQLRRGSKRKAVPVIA